MIPFRVIAIPTEIASHVRVSNKAPRYGHPAHTEVAAGYGPCRHCLRTFNVGAESRTLFTYNSFEGYEPIPLPGPIFIHSEPCDRYPETAGYPDDLRKHAAILNAFAKGQTLLDQRHIDDGSHASAVLHLLQRPDVTYTEVRDKNAGCYDFRIERVASPGDK